jgi:tetrahydromethanopterin S-methyltransferase subunit G
LNAYLKHQDEVERRVEILIKEVMRRVQKEI